MTFSKIKIQAIKEENYKYNSRTISSATDIVKIVNEIEELEKATEEITILICLNLKNQIVGFSEVAKGTLNACYLDFKSIFKIALSCNSSKIILIHNHPSEVAQPSKCDYDITNKLKEACKLMDFQLLDHIVIGGNNFASCM